MSNNPKIPINNEAQNANINSPGYNAPYPYTYLNPNTPPTPQMNQMNYQNYYWNNYQYQQYYQQQQQYNYYQQYNPNYMPQTSNVNSRPNESQPNNFNNFNRNPNYQVIKFNLFLFVGEKFLKIFFQNKNHHGHNFQNKNNRAFNNNTNHAKKPKIDKRDLPENNKFYCEVCDRGFKLEEKYNEHLDTHETCNVNGCKFTAAAKLVEIHYRNVNFY